MRKIWHMLCKIKYKIYLKKQLKKLDKKGIIYGENLKLYNVNFDDNYGWLIRIGDNCTMTNCTILTHDASAQPLLRCTKVAPVNIGNNVFVGFGAVVLPRVNIGDNSIIAAGSVVARDVPSNTVVGGVPAKVINSIEDYTFEIKKIMREAPKIYSKVDSLSDRMNLYNAIKENGCGISIYKDK